MELPRRILVGVSEDPRSDYAAVAAAFLAQQLDAEYELLHAFPQPPPAWIGESPATFEGKSAEVTGKLRAELGERLGIREQTHGLDSGALTERLNVVCGLPAYALQERAELTDADCIFLGPHARNRGLDFGNSARAVIHRSGRDTWIQPSSPRPLRQVLIPVDESLLASLALARGRALAGALGLGVRVLHCFSPADWHLRERWIDSTHRADMSRAQQSFAEYVSSFDWNGLDHDDLFVEGEPADVILRKQDEDQVIVMGTHGRTALGAHLLGSVAYTVLSRAETPVLAVRGREQPTV